MKVSILYNKFFDHYGDEQMVGGIETYLANLAALCKESGCDTTIYQWSKNNFQKNFSDISIRGISIFHLPIKKRNNYLFSLASSEIDINKDIVIFGADHVSVSTKNKKHISIQHGISWDLPVEQISSRKLVKYNFFSKIIKKRAVNLYKKYFENCPNTVCVDYNFMNWYRTTVPNVPDEHRVWVIPNFSAIAPYEEFKQRSYEKKMISLIFARRFVSIRGTRLFAEVMESLLKKYKYIHCTFAGEGPDESWLKSRFAGEQRVSFIKYFPGESLDVHFRHDIAVVPSLASEGTSLSVAEAMATGCPVVATGIGGITNMIIDGYNGILTSPNAASLREGIERLLENAQLRRNIGTRAYETASNAFSLEKWKHSWRRVLMEVARD